MIVYSFGFGFPFALHFVIKMLGGKRLSLAEVYMIVLYRLSVCMDIHSVAPYPSSFSA
jgi:hypothetical protein